MGLLILVDFLKLYVSFPEYSHFYRPTNRSDPIRLEKVFHTTLFLISFHLSKALFRIWVGTRLSPLFCGWFFKKKTFVDRLNNSVFLWVVLEWNLFCLAISIFFSSRFPSFSFPVVSRCPSFWTTMVFNTTACPNPMSNYFWNPHFNTLHHTTTHCNTLQHTANHCNKHMSCRVQPRSQEFIQTTQPTTRLCKQN